ncbi:MAG: matrixin family metalloprotease [Chloroflexi bacterium]|nr:matrixin family metalloprotease [Chloroflexota bacterium]
MPLLPARAPISALALGLALCALWLTAGAVRVSADAPPDGARPYDDGVEIYLQHDGRDGLVFAQFVRFFTDCSPGDFPPCGGPPGRWTLAKVPVAFCTFQANRPASITADAFREAVRAAARMWNAAELGIGVRYDGDCTTGTRWENSDGTNQIGFDDSRRVIQGSTAALARGSWSNVPRFGPVQDRQFNEFDIVLGGQLEVSDQCLRSILAHEVGHTLGLGHSDDSRDLMYATFNPRDPDGCKTVATSAERARLAELYGVNKAPTVVIQAPASVFTGTSVTLTARVTDPEGDPVTVSWKQTGGPTVQLTVEGHAVRFTAPGTAGTPLAFEVLALDRFLHEAAATVSVAVDVANRPPSASPVLDAFSPGAGGAVMGWRPVGEATSYEFCLDGQCQPVASPNIPVTWDVVLGAAGDPTQRRVIATGARTTSLAACNSVGCSRPGEGPRVGGLVWSAWDIDFDYLAWAYDVPAVGLRFTIGGVTNQAKVARSFVLYAGTADDPLQRVIHNCGSVVPGGVCFGVLTPQQAGHGSVLTILSDRPGTPGTEHRVQIR